VEKLLLSDESSRWAAVKPGGAVSEPLLSTHLALYRILSAVSLRVELLSPGTVSCERAQLQPLMILGKLNMNTVRVRSDSLLEQSHVSELSHSP
jgi:hypothetical protein